jgi:hypothetical protein
MRCLLFAAAIVALLTAPAFAWNALGHRVIAEIAWQQLDAPTRQNIVDTLKRHPRFGEDFILKMPRDVAAGDQATQDRWIFWQAAVWPDIARGIPGDARKLFDRPTWHYVNGPIYVDRSDRRALAQTLSFNLSQEYPTALAESDWNIIQATKHALAVLRDRRATPSKNAIRCHNEHTFR